MEKERARRILGKFGGVLALLLIVTALLVQIGRQLTPLVSDNREYLENYLSQQIHAKVSLGSIEARWKGFRPQLSFTDLTIVNAEGQQVLSIGGVDAQIDLWKSLRDWSLRLWRLELDGLNADIAQTPEGRWELRGVVFSARKENSHFLADAIDALLVGRFVRLDDMRATLDFSSGRRQQVLFTKARLDNDGEFHRLTADLDLPQQDDVVQLVYEGRGDPRDAKRFLGNGYLKLTNYPLSSSVALFSERLAEHSGIQDGFVSADFWLFSQPDASVDFEGELNFSRHPVADLQPDLPLPDLSERSVIPLSAVAEVTGNWNTLQEWQLHLKNFQAFWPKRQSMPLDVGIHRSLDAKNWVVQIPTIDAGQWLKEFESVPEVPESVRDILAELGVQGTLENIHLDISHLAPEDFLLRANVKNVSVQAWKGSPQIESVDGYLEASAYSGFVEIDSQQGLLLNFPELFDDAFRFEKGQGVVGWAIRPDQNIAQVYSGRLNMKGKLGDASGYFYLDAPLDRDSRPLELMLQIGLQNANAKDHKHLVPRVVPQSLLDWLDQSIVSGNVPQGGFLLHSYLGHGATNARSIQLALEAKEAELNYDSRWPALKNLSGFLEIDTDLVQAWLDGGQFLQTEMQPSYLEVAENPAGDGMLLQINGEVVGKAQSGLDILTQSPIHEVIGGGLDAWQLHGQLNTKVQLHIPLSAGEPGSKQQVDAVLNGAELSMPELGLTFNNVTGQLHYSDQHGLNARQLAASLWGRKLALEIESSGHKLSGHNSPGHQAQTSPASTTNIHFSGPLDFTELAKWSRRPEALFVEGVVPVTGTVAVSGGDVPVRIQARTNLQGAAIDLPAPYGKAANDLRSLDVDIPVRKDSIQYRFKYDDLVTVQLNAHTGAAKNLPVQGVVALGQSPSGRSDPGIWLEGVADIIDGEAWWPVIKRYGEKSTFLSNMMSEVQPLESTSQSQSQSQSPLSGQPIAQNVRHATTYLNFDLLVNSLRLGGAEFKAIQIGGGQRQQGWRIRVDDELLKGELFLADDDRPLSVNLDYIRWPQIKTDGTGEGLSERLAEFRPQDLIDVDLKIGELKIGARNFGAWSLKARPTDAGLILNSVVGTAENLKVTGADADATKTGEGATLIWVKNDRWESTQFIGKLTGKNLADISDNFELPRLLDSESVELDTDLRWSGSPVDFSVNELRGTLSLDVEDGHFYRSTGQASSAFLRLVGLFNFDSWIRRLKLDFSDVFQGGTPFEQIKGALKFDRGTLYLTDPITVTNTSSVLKMGGKIQLEAETLDTSLVATLPVGGNATLIAALAGGLPAAAGVYAISKIFKKQMNRVASVSYRIQGPWADPQVEFDKLFDDKAAEKAAEGSRDAIEESTKERREAWEKRRVERDAEAVKP